MNPQEWWEKFQAAADTLSVPGAVHDVFGVGPDLQGRLLRSIIIILVLVAGRWLVARAIRHNVDDLRGRYRWRKTVTYVFVAIGFLLVGRVWFQGFGDIATILGFLGAGLAIALREPIANMAGWAFILWRRPFHVGDRIEIGKHAGDVIDLRVFSFSLLEIGNWVHADQSTGRIVHVPNGEVFREHLANYTQSFSYIWNEVPVLLTFESDWEKAKRLLQEIADEDADNLSEDAKQRVMEASRRFMIFYTTLTPTVYTLVQESGVSLTVRYLTDPRNRRGSEQKLWESILREFAKHEDIDFAYPTWRILNDPIRRGAESHPSVGGSDLKPPPPRG